jgi:DNA polymerase-4
MPALCRDCLATFEDAKRCPACGRPRVIAHPELFTLSIAHMDCDAFYASVEKRDDPSLRDRPVIVGGGRRGVVTTACYIARIRGVRSAQPMFKALQLCPDAVVVKGRMDRYVEISRQIRAMMEELTPIVEPLSLDEAFLDLTGTARLHHAPPALLLARLVRRMETELGISGSIGLSHAKFLAKVASDLDKPRGFSVIGKAETVDFLRPRPVRLIPGIGAKAAASLESLGIRTFDDVHRWEKTDLIRRLGHTGERLWHLARGEDHRRVSPHEPVKGISNETTFGEDTADPDILDGHIWRLAEKVADRAKAKDLAGRVVTLKLKRHDHKSLTRRISLPQPTQMADRIYRTARGLFDACDEHGPFRLLGVGLSELTDARDGDREGDLLEPDATTRAEAERAADRIRARFGQDAILKGRALR